MRLIPAEELEPYLEEAFPSSFEERLAISRKVVRGLNFPFPEDFLEPLLEKASRPACFYGRATVDGQGLVLLRLGNAAALAGAHTHSLFPESWETFPTFSAFRRIPEHFADLAQLRWEEAALGLARALKAWAEARGLQTATLFVIIHISSEALPLGPQARHGLPHRLAVVQGGGHSVKNRAKRGLEVMGCG